ncbi:hypothetical protein PFICI_10019 [Pestalotiopsis fici W106-1]|uniref:BZIP domain-containing protein n=1 Tax=Pestalotiopsis fici (strain W106-1 / CGMCC3.15140) TaxID=1229662 RepID=W3WXU2_PESFW|nr:uncharacterized protein PFICI_10019 [Pestalotiopsis fici W106-1]ETS77957.1 hypothetical protein PFICI_10019 [Pestalotiopsis fici W106-1]
MSQPTADQGVHFSLSTGRDQDVSQANVELHRKRARDRKSQQAMRDRQRGLIQSLTERVDFLTRTLDGTLKDVGLLESKVITLEAENAQLRAQNAAWQLGLLGRAEPTETVALKSLEPWTIPPRNSPPCCIADNIVQNFILSKRAEMASVRPNEIHGSTRLKPNPASLLSKQHGTVDEVSNVVADLVRSYPEIESLPKQVAVFYIMGLLSKVSARKSASSSSCDSRLTYNKWLIYLDKESWDLMPEWLRPTECQLSTVHAAWVDRIPWPKARNYLVQHSDITLDDFASTYSSSFQIKWDFDPSHVLITIDSNKDEPKQVLFNPVFESEIRQLKNWTVEETFRQRFPEIATLIDKDTILV